VLNYVAVLLAALASFAFGAAWYGALAKAWLAARGDADGPQAMARLGPIPIPYLIAFLAELVMAWMLAGILLHLARGGLVPGPRNGLTRRPSCGSGLSPPRSWSTTPSKAPRRR